MQGFRKYLTRAQDHEEVLAFLLGQLIKEKVHMYQLRNHALPDKIQVPIAEFEAMVRQPSKVTDLVADHFPDRLRNVTFTAPVTSSALAFSVRMDIRLRTPGETKASLRRSSESPRTTNCNATLHRSFTQVIIQLLPYLVNCCCIS